MFSYLLHCLVDNTTNVTEDGYLKPIPILIEEPGYSKVNLSDNGMAAGGDYGQIYATSSKSELSGTNASTNSNPSLDENVAPISSSGNFSNDNGTVK